jgi:hypothetical protein
MTLECDSKERLTEKDAIEQLTSLKVIQMNILSNLRMKQRGQTFM